MSQELIYTSVPAGLKPGSKGFCTVAVTAGLSTAWIERLESLSGYRPVYALGDPNSQRNPVNWAHWRVVIAGKSRSVLSRVAFAGADYSGRSNKLAHHIVLEPGEQAAGGPAWMELKPGVMRTTWTGAPQQIPSGPKLPAGDSSPRVCSAWASARGDAGWAGALAESFVTEPTKPAYIIYSPGTDVLSLFEESLSLLPPAKRWEVTFSTFFTELPLNLSCAWRAVVAGTPAANEALRLGPRALILDLTKPATAPPIGAYANAARTGSGPAMPDQDELGSGPATRKPATVGALLSSAEDTSFGLPIDKEDETAVITGTSTRRRRLLPVAKAFSMEEELPDLPDLSDTYEGGKMPPQVVVRRGVPGWLTTLIAVACLAGGGIIGFKIATFRRSMASHAQTANAVEVLTQKPVSLAEGAPTTSHPSEEQSEILRLKALLAAQSKVFDEDNAVRLDLENTKQKLMAANKELRSQRSQALDTSRQAAPNGPAASGSSNSIQKSSATPTELDDSSIMDSGTPPLIWLKEKAPTNITADSEWTRDESPNDPSLKDVESLSLAWRDNSTKLFVSNQFKGFSLIVRGNGRVIEVISDDAQSGPSSSPVILRVKFDGGALTYHWANEEVGKQFVIPNLPSCVFILRDKVHIVAKLAFGGICHSATLGADTAQSESFPIPFAIQPNEVLPVEVMLSSDLKCIGSA